MTDWLFGPGSMAWRINRESVLLLGGRAALLMQLAHPLVAAGVADHSDFRSDPFKRLRKTLDLMLTLVFSDQAKAEQVVAAVNAVHDHVHGSASDGRSYSARDPKLLLWVWATLVDSSVRCYEAFVAELDPTERETYYAETRVIAAMFGIPEDILPKTLDDLWAWMGAQIDSGEVAVTPTARDLANTILSPLPFVPRRLSLASAMVTPYLLPTKIREGYGLRLDAPRLAAVSLARRAARLVVPRLPSVLREFPAARFAER